jgi:predicted phage terminase large subunit-like protein
MRESLIGFAQNIDIPGAPVKDDETLDDFDRTMALGRGIETGISAHHILLMNKLQETMEKPYGRLMVFMPPGGAKSTYGSVVAPTWYMGRYPGSRIILTSYGTELAKKHGTKARAIVRQQNYQNAFGCTLSKETGAREMWALTNNSEYMSGGLLSGITGNRANGIIIDDPIKGRAEAESKVIRDRTLEAFQDDLKTRFLPQAWMVLIQTRWHDEDLAGLLLPDDYDGESGAIKCRDGLTWEVINLPAKCEREDDPLGRKVGDYLWPEWFDEKHWFQYEPRPGDVDSPNERTWSALYQQRPRPDHGNQFERDWVNWYDLGRHPKYLNYYSASDYSVSDGEGDFTEHGIAGLDQHGELWLVDWWYGQNPPDITIDALLRLAKLWGVRHGFDEKGLIEKAIKPAFQMRQRQMGIYMTIDYLPTIGDKVARFQSFRHMASSGKLHVPRCPWGERLVDQLCVFPGRAKDDAVDVCSLFGRGLEEMVWSRNLVPETDQPSGIVFGSWEWLTHGTEHGLPDKKPRVF